jgi:hypothetical protein
MFSKFPRKDGVEEHYQPGERIAADAENHAAGNQSPDVEYG